MCKGDRIVNECVTMSIDPLSLSCLVCTREHKMAECISSPFVAFADQNMAPVIGKCSDSAMVTVQLENASLAELGSFA